MVCPYNYRGKTNRNYENFVKLAPAGGDCINAAFKRDRSLNKALQRNEKKGKRESFC